ncbi:MAG: preprotein translocase subunit YajC [Bacteroidetes bacterium]|nr:preprotein translocase subunit YajC [Bacteroidota bacterium]
MITLLQAPGGSNTTMILMMVVMFVGFYFLMIRPQVKKQNQEKKFQESLKVGQRVVTTSGMHARIAQILEDGIVLETLSGKLKFEKSAISRDYTQTRFPETKES